MHTIVLTSSGCSDVTQTFVTMSPLQEKGSAERCHWRSAANVIIKIITDPAQVLPSNTCIRCQVLRCKQSATSTSPPRSTPRVICIMRLGQIPPVSWLIVAPSAKMGENYRPQPAEMASGEGIILCLTQSDVCFFDNRFMSDSRNSIVIIKLIV